MTKSPQARFHNCSDNQLFDIVLKPYTDYTDKWCKCVNEVFELSVFYDQITNTLTKTAPPLKDAERSTTGLIAMRSSIHWPGSGLLYIELKYFHSLGNQIVTWLLLLMMSCSITSKGF